jgi:hypothetical protein
MIYTTFGNIYTTFGLGVRHTGLPGRPDRPIRPGFSAGLWGALNMQRSYFRDPWPYFGPLVKN